MKITTTAPTLAPQVKPAENHTVQFGTCECCDAVGNAPQITITMAGLPPAKVEWHATCETCGPLFELPTIVYYVLWQRHVAALTGEGDSKRATMTPGSGGPAGFQARVAAWMQECFGPTISADRLERNDRFIEEALELTQASGYSKERAHALVEYVFNRPVGEIGQETGGVLVTLAAHALAHGINIGVEADLELARISVPDVMEKIRRKQATKPTGSALPSAAANASEPVAPQPSSADTSARTVTDGISPEHKAAGALGFILADEECVLPHAVRCAAQKILEDCRAAACRERLAPEPAQAPKPAIAGGECVAAETCERCGLMTHDGTETIYLYCQCHRDIAAEADTAKPAQAVTSGMVQSALDTFGMPPSFKAMRKALEAALRAQESKP